MWGLDSLSLSLTLTHSLTLRESSPVYGLSKGPVHSKGANPGSSDLWERGEERERECSLCVVNQVGPIWGLDTLSQINKVPKIGLSTVKLPI